MFRRKDRLRAALPLAAVLVLSATGCRPTPSGWTPVMLELPKAYRAEASGEIRIDDLRLPGRVRVDYLIYPDNLVVMQSLHAWVRDVDIVTRFVFIEVSRERLRCTEFSNEDLVFGTYDPTAAELTFPARTARMSGHSYSNRAPDRTCLTPARTLTARNDREIVVNHDPAANAFGLGASFRASYDGNDVTVDISADGRFLNRPPEPLIGVGGPSIPLDRIQGGCPEVLPLNPPGAVPNDPRGLLLNLVANSSDPDGAWKRSDIVREEWSHSVGTSGSPFRLLGRGRVSGPHLFESDREHWLMLTTWDRTGASFRDLCYFRVLRPDEVPAP